MTILQYSFRENVATQLNTLALDKEGISSLCNERSRYYLYKDIKSISLKYDPTRVQTNRYLMDIEFKNVPRLRVINSSYEGFADFKDLSNQYHGFVTALHKKLTAKDLNIQYKAGASSLSYAASVLCLIFACVILLFSSGYLLLSGMLWIVFIKLILMVVYLPAAWKYMKRNKPRNYQPDNIPAELLPK